MITSHLKFYQQIKYIYLWSKKIFLQISTYLYIAGLRFWKYCFLHFYLNRKFYTQNGKITCTPVFTLNIHIYCQSSWRFYTYLYTENKLESYFCCHINAKLFLVIYIKYLFQDVFHPSLWLVKDWLCISHLQDKLASIHISLVLEVQHLQEVADHPLLYF